jgi:hypothetical protein
MQPIGTLSTIRKAVFDNVELTNDQIIQVLNDIGEQGDIILLKNDGIRLENKYTVVIISGTEKFNSIRLDGAHLSQTLSACLRSYFEALDRG